MLPDTVDPFAGEVIAAVGAVVSIGAAKATEEVNKTAVVENTASTLYARNLSDEKLEMVFFILRLVLGIKIFM